MSNLVPVAEQGREHPWGSQYLEAFRRIREANRLPSGSGSDRKRAVVTIVHNEPVFLPIWLRHYSRHFAPEHIYVLDNETTDGSTSTGGFVRIPVAHDRVDHAWMVRTIEELQHELLDRYDMVLVTDVDEIVVPRPEFGTLTEYLDRFDEEFINCLGYEILHLRDVEPPLNPSRPILDQRGYWFVNSLYEKPALATVPMNWKPGFHAREDEAFVVDPDLYMVHLHRVDYGICKARHRLRHERRWERRDLETGWAAHNRVADDEEFDHWFYRMDNRGTAVEPIPTNWGGLF
jgi:hypothetical protein